MRFKLFYRSIAPAAALLTALPMLAQSAGDAGPRELWFTDEAAAAGIEFVHETGALGQHHLPETMGSGVGWLDYDNDGHQDLYFVQSGPLPGSDPRARAGRGGNQLYRNLGAGRFEPVITGAEDLGFGMGVAIADYDNDGWRDLFVSNFGANALYRNNGDGTFSRQDGPWNGSVWSASAAWGDLDHDGLVDLYVSNYIAYDVATDTGCGNPAGGTAYCHIDLFDGLADELWHNQGDGRFREISTAVGVSNPTEGKGLGVVMGDFNTDGLTDIYVANDTKQNFMYVNLGDLRFEDQGLFSGTGYSEEGKSQAGMGAEVADLDGNGTNEILVTNFAFETNNLYRQIADTMYLDDTALLGFGEPGFPNLAFGIAVFDADGDGDRDIAVANGHILDTIDPTVGATSYEQRNHLFRNHLVELRRAAISRGELDPANPAASASWRPGATLLSEVSETAGPGFAPIEVSRGLATGDADGDGRPDLAINNSGSAARLLLNRGASGHHSLVVRLRGRTGNRDALGARVRVTPLGDAADGTAGFPQYAEVRSASSYSSQGAADLVFGLGSSARARVEVDWPGGDSQRFDDVAADRIVLCYEGAEQPVTGALQPRR